MGRCGCSQPSTCGCFFDASSDIVPTGTGAENNPMVLGFAPGKLPVIVCTSGTRPPSPVLGQVIVETDTGLMYRYVDGWQRVGNLFVDGDTNPILKHGTASADTSTAGGFNVHFPAPFPTQCFIVVATLSGSSDNMSVSIPLKASDVFVVTFLNADNELVVNQVVQIDWIAIGN